MAAATTVPYVSLEEYLHTFPSPDVDYIDGVLEERNMGELDHGDLQTELATLFRNHRDAWQVRAVVELRVQVLPTRFRIPDVCILPLSLKRTPIVREAPLLCLEVKSPEFSLAKERRRADDYIRMGTREVWIFDPEKRKAYVLQGETLTEHTGPVMRFEGTPIEIDLVALFDILDQ